jgi:MFS family permease
MTKDPAMTTSEIFNQKGKKTKILPTPCTGSSRVPPVKIIIENRRMSGFSFETANEKPGLTKTLLRATFFSSVGGLLFGYDLGVISGALPQIVAAFNLNESEEESVVSFLYIGGIFGATLGGYICDFYGRKLAILFTDILFVWGGLILYFSQSYAAILCGRLVVGVAVAVQACAKYSYLSEISPLQVRGSIVSVNEACITLGFLLACASVFILDPLAGWRYMFIVLSVVAVIQFLGMVFLPESPIWLATQNKVEEAKNSLRRINEFTSLDDLNHYYNTDFHYILEAEASGYFTPIKQNIGDSTRITESHPEKAESGTWKPLFRQSIIAAYLIVIQQFCGHSNLLNFSTIIFESAGMGQQSSLVSAMLLGTVKFMVSILIIWKIEAVGRRLLLLLGIVLMELSLLCLILAFQGQNIASSTTDTSLVKSVALFAVIGAIGMVAGYAASFGPLTWLIASEMFPSNIRGRALGASTVLNNICASLVPYTFLSVSTYFGNEAAPFVMYALITLFALVFAVAAIPDTSFKSPTDIHKDIQQMPFWTFLDVTNQQICLENSAQNSKVLPIYTEKNDLGTSLI